MKLRSILPIALLAVLGTHHAFAQEAKTREQVRAELAQAIRSGELQSGGDAALPLNQLRPDLYPHAPVASRSRDEVKAELAEALRTGDIVAGESGYRLNELNPSLYPPVAMVAGKSRDEAKAELAEALRNGEIVEGGEVALTRSALSPHRYQDNLDRALAGRNPARAKARGIFSLAF